MAEDEMVGWRHRLNGRELWEMVRDERGLLCCSPWGRKKSDTAQRLYNNKCQSSPQYPPLIFSLNTFFFPRAEELKWFLFSNNKNVTDMFLFLFCLLFHSVFACFSEAVLKIENPKFRLVEKLLIPNAIVQNLALRMFISALVMTENNW